MTSDPSDTQINHGIMQPHANGLNTQFTRKVSIFVNRFFSSNLFLHKMVGSTTTTTTNDELMNNINE